jgi:cytochrome c biogenesis protein CcdA/thiol-disulfide isomerase/thioredoxin
MSLVILAYLAGVLTILSPCILPVVPFILARANQTFHRNGLPMLLGLAFAFAAVASLAAIAGGWAVEANRFGRAAAMVLLAAFGLGLIFPALAARFASPLVATGSRLSAWAQDRRTGTLSSVVLGVATGLLWTPCAGPVLGLILSGAALNGPGLQTSALLLAYGLGAATSLAAALLAGRQILARLRPSLIWIERARRLAGAAMVGSVVILGLGLDTSLLQRLSAEQTYKLETMLVTRSANPLGRAEAAVPETLSGPLAALLDGQGWINSPPLRAEALRGKVVLVNFWTYSCINCLRVLPHVKCLGRQVSRSGPRRDRRAHAGIRLREERRQCQHRNDEARRQLSRRDRQRLPDLARLQQQCLAGALFVGADGRIRHQAIGEGRYDQSEQVIRRLLAERIGPICARPRPIWAMTRPSASPLPARSPGTRRANTGTSPRCRRMPGACRATGRSAPNSPC